ncbi:MAG: YlmC/YmxH family sporulation protein [bacterium]|nr:YlmC/YmxH family sporulation protein [bacterium]
MRIYDLRQKEVINACNCERLGFVGDVEIDIETGCILKIIVPGPCKVWGILGRDTEYVIDWASIRQIGPDIILVDVNLEDVLTKCKL